MDFKKLVKRLGINSPDELDGLKLYDYIRSVHFQKFNQRYFGAFQSPSVKPTTTSQRTKFQLDEEHSVYQRSDFTPLRLESQINKLYPAIGGIVPFTLMFNSGMAAISSVAYYLYTLKKIKKLTIGENSYFETKWLVDDYGNNLKFNEYKLDFNKPTTAYWFEFPINCTQPDKYPFDQQIDLKKILRKIITQVSTSTEKKYLVIDYTLSTLPFDISKILKKVPKNLTIFLVTSLQKHRGLGLDLTNGGALTVYSHDISSDKENLPRIRAICGGSITQETQWLMPPLNKNLINKIIVDSGKEARKLFAKIARPELPVKYYCAVNDQFQTSFVFVKIDEILMKKSKKVPYYSDLLIAELIASAKTHNAILIQGTSFGFPFSRIFKNSERYDNTSSLRIAVGYDSQFNKNLGEAILKGTDNFLKKYDK